METKYRVLQPKEYSGDIHGDFGYEINGIKSERSYSSLSGAKKAMHRELGKVTCADCNKVRSIEDTCDCGSTTVRNDPNAGRLMEALREVRL